MYRILSSTLIASSALISYAQSTIKVTKHSRQAENMHILFDFRDKNETTQQDIANEWWEVSDTVRTVGMSKATLSLQTTEVFQRGILFALLNPQPNGAGFAGVKHSLEGADLTGHAGIEIQCRAQGLKHWKVVLNHAMAEVDPSVTYEAVFQLDPADKTFSYVRIPFDAIHPYRRGQLYDAPPIKLDQLKAFGLQTYGGVYSEEKQSGPGTLEIEYVGAYFDTNQI